MSDFTAQGESERPSLPPVAPMRLGVHHLFIRHLPSLPAWTLRGRTQCYSSLSVPVPSKCCALTQVFTQLSRVAMQTNRHVSWGSARSCSRAVDPPSEMSILPRPRPGQLFAAVPRLWKPIPLPQVVKATDSGDTGTHWDLYQWPWRPQGLSDGSPAEGLCSRP